jgi:F0F1-type ATP synthase assembly protein I
MKNIYKSWKTTLLGIVLIASGIGYTFVNASPDYILVSLLIGTGIGFVFAPDSVIELLKNKSKDGFN